MATAANRVVVADDSPLMRRMLRDALSAAGLEVVGEAGDGDEALKLCSRHEPAAMTLDLAMPGLDGIGVLKELRRRAQKVPVVVVSAFSPAHGARAVDALAEGAFDLIAKPVGADGFDAFAQSLVAKINLAAAERVRVSKPAAPVAPRRPARSPSRRTQPPVVVIASSTGGPRALAHLVPNLPSPLGAGSLIVQHMPPGFTGSLAARLDRESKLNVREVEGGEPLAPGVCLMAPGGKHLRVGADRRTFLSDDPEVGGLRPRADLTIADVAQMYGERVILVVLTGMGRDGEDGARAVRAAGGRVLAEAEQTCVVYGMPRAVIESGLADSVHPLHELPAAIVAEVSR